MLLCPSSAEGCSLSPSTTEWVRRSVPAPHNSSMCSSGRMKPVDEIHCFTLAMKTLPVVADARIWVKKTLQQVAPGRTTVGHHPHISHMPVLVSSHSEITFLWAEDLRRQQDTEVLDTTKLALRLQPSSLFPFSSLEVSLDKANCTYLICTRRLGHSTPKITWIILCRIFSVRESGVQVI